MKDIDGNGYYDVNDFLNMKNEEILEMNNDHFHGSSMNKGKKFDIILMNPPYLGSSRNDYNFPLKFLNKVNEISNRVISVQPVQFLYKTYERKSPEQTEKTIINTIENYKTDILTINQFDFEGAYSTTKTAIIDIKLDKDDKENITVNGVKYPSVSKITKFSSDKLLSEFHDIIKPLYKEDSIIKHWVAIDKRNEKSGKDLRRVNDSKKDKPFVNVAVIRGHIGTNDMYSILPSKRKPEYGERPYSYINFNNEDEANNFCNYIKTDFASTCVYLYKNDINLSTSLNYIPWFDFSDEHFNKSPREIDDWLFKKYNISDEIRKHIEEILPDYYNIR